MYIEEQQSTYNFQLSIFKRVNCIFYVTIMKVKKKFGEVFKITIDIAECIVL